MFSYKDKTEALQIAVTAGFIRLAVANKDVVHDFIDEYTPRYKMIYKSLLISTKKISILKSS
jgi:hypothetical protein